MLEVPGFKCVRSPVDQRAQSTRRVVAGILRVVAGSHDKDIWDIPSLAVTVHHACSRVTSDDGSARVVSALIRGGREGPCSRLIDDNRGAHLPRDFAGLVRDVPAHAQVVFWKIKGHPEKRKSPCVAIGWIQVKVVPARST